MSDFYKYFKENMDALNLPAPESLYGSITTAHASITGLLTYTDKFGPRVTVMEMIIRSRSWILQTLASTSLPI